MIRLKARAGEQMPDWAAASHLDRARPEAHHRRPSCLWKGLTSLQRAPMDLQEVRRIRLREAASVRLIR
jgi:hypothetical protein